MSTPGAANLMAAILAGAVAGALVAGALSRTPQGPSPEVRAALDASAQAVRRTAAIQERLLQRVEALEEHARVVAETAADDASRTAVERLSTEISGLRAALQDELSRADERLTRLEAWVAGARPGSGEGDAPELGDEALRELAILARDPDPGIRFSALSMLGRRRTDRGVQASRDSLDDESDLVVWQAIRNLGRFEERSEALQVVPHLDHAAAVIRAAAWEALRAMGAPDAGFDPSAPAEERAGAVTVLRKWAYENQ